MFSCLFSGVTKTTRNMELVRFRICKYTQLVWSNMKTYGEWSCTCRVVESNVHRYNNLRDHAREDKRRLEVMFNKTDVPITHVKCLVIWGCQCKPKFHLRKAEECHWRRLCRRFINWAQLGTLHHFYDKIIRIPNSQPARYSGLAQYSLSFYSINTVNT